MQSTHQGVLLPESMRDATDAEKDVYAARAKANSRALITAYHAIEDAAAERGLTMEDLEAMSS